MTNLFGSKCAQSKKRGKERERERKYAFAETVSMRDTAEVAKSARIILIFTITQHA